MKTKTVSILGIGLLLGLAVLFYSWGNSTLAAGPDSIGQNEGLGVVINPAEVTFGAVGVPTTLAGKAAIRASSEVTIDGQPYQIGYHTILQTGDKLNSGVFGQLLDINGDPLLDEDGEPIFSSEIDYSSFLPRGDKIYMVTHFEETPAAMYLTTLLQDPETGTLTAVDTAPIDFSAQQGILEVCAGVTTPWSSHLGSEEWDPDARPYDPETGSIDDEDYDEAMLSYFGPEADLTQMTPYNYGWTPEVFVDADGTVTPVKHYAMGRFAHELAYVMPDNRTVYMTDDETNGGLFMFIADEPQNLSAGTLYAAKWLQTSAEGAGSANLAWIRVGQASNQEIGQLIGSTQFSDIFAAEEPAADGSCPAEYTSINTTAGHECLAVKAGMEQAAAFLETRRYAALLGATTEWAANEGITYDPAENVLYIAPSGIDDGMLDNQEEYDLGGNNDIRLPEATSCAGIYALALAADQNAYPEGYQVDAQPTAPIESQYVAINMNTILVGNEWTQADAEARGYGEIYEFNECDVDGIAEPDNVTFIPGTDTLIIAEDSEEHENDYLWAFNTETKALTRIKSTPHGSEVSTPFFFPNVGGFAYLTSAVQHPFDAEELIEEIGYPEETVPSGDTRATLGYFGPMPGFQYE